MKKAYIYFRKYGYLLALSVGSALLVVVLQYITGKVFPSPQQEFSNIRLEKATGQIISRSQNPLNDQFVSTLTETQITKFQKVGLYEDMEIQTSHKSMGIRIESLLVSLDQIVPITNIGQNPPVISYKLSENTHIKTALCDDENTSRQSCTIYLVAKSGQSIPVYIKMQDPEKGREGIIIVETEHREMTSSGIFTGKPIAINLQAW